MRIAAFQHCSTILILATKLHEETRKEGRWEDGKPGSQEDRKEHREKKLVKTILIKRKGASHS